MKPLRDPDDDETTKVVALLANPDQLSALIVLTNYDRKGADNVRIPHGAGCNNFGQYAFEEAATEYPRAVVGLNDISARYITWANSLAGTSYPSRCRTRCTGQWRPTPRKVFCAVTLGKQ